MTICRYGDPLCPCQDGDTCNHAGKNVMVPVFQEIVIDWPPIYEQLAKAFNLFQRRDVIFSFGDRIYNPYGVVVPPDLLAHEAIHGHRQGSGEKVLDWWKRYIDDKAFRFAEEVEAHRAELNWLNAYAPRSERRRALKTVADKLASPLYGPMVTARRAKAILRGWPKLRGF